MEEKKINIAPKYIPQPGSGYLKSVDSIENVQKLKKNTEEKKIKVRIAGGYGNSNDIKWLINNVEIVKSVKDADLIVATGGADIDPEIYGEKINRRTYINESRDQNELIELKQAIDLGIPIIGICRGAQLSCALAGGKLVQHVTNHGSNHTITIMEGDYKNYEYVVNSMHHQMMYPFFMKSKDYSIIAKTSQARSTTYENDSEKEQMNLPYEPEIIYFNNINAYAIQCHPEMMSSMYIDFLNFLKYDIQLKFSELFDNKNDKSFFDQAHDEAEKLMHEEQLKLKHEVEIKVNEIYNLTNKK
jgi:GMP synthase-like glutamine amidotransferase